MPFRRPDPFPQNSLLPARVSYALTDKGKALRPAIRELRAWAQRWNGTHS